MESVVEGRLDVMDLEALRSDEDVEVEQTSPVSARERAEFLEDLAHANTEPSPSEVARISAAIDRRHRQQDAHPLSRESSEYAETARRLIGVLDPMLRAAGDPIGLEALETIHRFALFIHVKIRRAVAGLLPFCEDLGDDDEFRRSDANGCAKLVRLVVAESRDAWRLLTLLPTIAADGVPAAMMARLDELDQKLERAFPDAMTFVRSGFDEEER